MNENGKFSNGMVAQLASCLSILSENSSFTLGHVKTFAQVWRKRGRGMRVAVDKSTIRSEERVDNFVKKKRKINKHIFQRYEKKKIDGNGFKIQNFFSIKVD